MDSEYGVDKMKNFKKVKTLAPQGIQPNGGGGALSSDYVSKLGSKEVSKKLRNFIPRPYDGRGCHEVTGEGESQIAQSLQEDPFCTKSIDFGKRRQVRDDRLRHPELVSGSQLHDKCDVRSRNCVRDDRYSFDFFNPCHRALIARSVSRLHQRVAFTLAEVLITLGVIGVVASLTLPSVINDIKHKQLETAFKSAYSIFSQGFMNMKREDGEGLHRNYAYYDAENYNYPMVTEFKNKFYSYSNIKVIGKCSYKNGSIKNFNKTANVTNNELLIGNIYQANNFDVLSNGMCSKVFINARYIRLFVDINGLKAPNQLGYDIFHFYIDDKDVLQPEKMRKLYTEEELAKENYPTLAGLPCSIKSKQAGNGIGCTYYALINQNPDDPTKGYWETLP